MALAEEEIKVIDHADHHAVILLYDLCVFEVSRYRLSSMDATEIHKEPVVYKEVYVVVASEGKSLRATIVELRVVFETKMEVSIVVKIAVAVVIDREEV